MSWTATTFEHAPLAIIDGDRGKNYPSQNELTDEGYCLFLSATNVTKSGFSFDTCQFISQEKHDALRKGTVDRGDIILTTRGTLGNVAHYSASVPFSPVRINSGMVTIKPDTNVLLPAFVYYFVKSELFQSQVRTLQSGVAQPQLPVRDIKKIKFQYPDLPTQQRIAGILSAYDDLIENNRRRIGLLEQAARLLYREWFVHLRFPGHETAKIVDGLPEGWERATLSDYVELVKEVVQPGAFRPDDVHIGLEHIPRRSFVLSDWEPTEGLESHKFRFAAGDIIFGKIRPYFHKVGFALRDGVASSDAFVWRVKDQGAWSLLICATSSDHFVAVASKTVKEGSKMPRADWKVLAKYKIPKPNDDLLAEFDGRVRPIAEECRKLALQNRALTRARDLLLPRLMDGRIPV